MLKWSIFLEDHNLLTTISGKKGHSIFWDRVRPYDMKDDAECKILMDDV